MQAIDLLFMYVFMYLQLHRNVKTMHAHAPEVLKSGEKLTISFARPNYRITRMFCEHQTFANFTRADQFATIKSAKPKLLLVNTHDPCQMQ